MILWLNIDQKRGDQKMSKFRKLNISFVSVMCLLMFPSLYSSASSEVQKSIRLMLMAMGKAEIMAKGHTDREIWYKKERQIWSEYLYNTFNIKEELEPAPEKSTESDSPNDAELTEKKKQNA